MNTPKLYKPRPTTVPPQTIQAPGRAISREYIRAIKMNPKPGIACFVCPVCKTRFDITYSRFGKLRVFEAPTYYCYDCSDASSFTRTD